MRLSEKIEETTGHIELALVQLKFMAGDSFHDQQTNPSTELASAAWLHYTAASLALEVSLDAIAKTKKQTMIA